MMNVSERFEKLWLECFSIPMQDEIAVEEALEDYIQKLCKIESDVNEEEEVLDEATALRRIYCRYKEWFKCFWEAKHGITKKGNIQTKEIMALKALIKNAINKQHPNLYVHVETRLKTVSSFNEKIWRDGCTPSKAIIRLKDMIGFRIIIDDSYPKEHVIDCYLVAETLKYALEEIGINQVNGGKLKQVNPKPSNPNNEMIYVPLAEEIPVELTFLPLAKDYISNPKENGYQGLHLFFSNPEEEDTYEIQVKTGSMFDFCENHAAAHYLYKLLTTSQNEKKDLTIFNKLKGFRSLDGEHYIDFSGFLTPIVL